MKDSKIHGEPRDIRIKDTNGELVGIQELGAEERKDGHFRNGDVI